MWREIGEFFNSVATEFPDCRCILLTGKGKGFCAGIDIFDEKFGNVFQSTNEIIAGSKNKVDTARTFLSASGMIRDMQNAFSALEKCPVPVVAAIHGSCIGGGIDLACAADIRLCSSDAIFSVMEIKLGLAADVGTLQRLPKIVGNQSIVRELCLTGRNFGAEEAAKIGFVSKCFQSSSILLKNALELCSAIAKNSPVAIVGTKKSLIFSRDHTVDEGLEHVAMHNSAALMTDDMKTSLFSISNEGGPSSPKFDSLLPLSKL